METLFNIPGMQAICDATGISDPWVVISLCLLIICVILIVALIATVKGKRRIAKDLVTLKEYSSGLEAITALPSIETATGDNEAGHSIVFPSVREARLKKAAAEKQAARSADKDLGSTQELMPLPHTPGQEEDEKSSETVTAAVHDAIYASITGNLRRSGSNAEEEAPAKSPMGHRSKSNGALLKSSDLPVIRPIEKYEPKSKAHKAVHSSKERASKDVSLSKRIPRL